jgi:hypothetical protein
MAIYRFSVSVVSRGAGQSVIAKAAYNSRDKIRDERTGELKDYSRAGGVLFSGIFAPKDAPAWTRDRAQLWNAVERKEDASTRRNQAQLARDIELALPHELTDQQRKLLVTDFVREQFVRNGMVADVNIHAPGGKGDDRNYHAHILVTMREIGPDGFGRKVREWNSKEQLEHWREQWEKIQNRYLERHGHEARVDRRTLEAQGIDREPTTHRGPHVDAMQRKGMDTERGAAARETFYRNLEIDKLKRELAHVQKQIAAAERQQRQPRPLKTSPPSRGQARGGREKESSPRFQGAARATISRTPLLKRIHQPQRGAPARTGKAISVPSIPTRAPLRAVGKTLDLVGNVFGSLFAPTLTPEQIREGEKATRKRQADTEQSIDFSKYTALRAQERHQQEQEREAERRQHRDRDRGGRER